MPPLFLPCCLMDIDGWTMNDEEKNIYPRSRSQMNSVPKLKDTP